MTLREWSPRQGSPLSCVMLVTRLGRTFNTAAARRNATPRPSSSLSSAFSASSDKASWGGKHRAQWSFRSACTRIYFSRRWSLLSRRVRGMYSEDGVMVVQRGPSLTGVAGYREDRSLFFVDALLLRDTEIKPYSRSHKSYELKLFVLRFLNQHFSFSNFFIAKLFVVLFTTTFCWSSLYIIKRLMDTCASSSRFLYFCFYNTQFPVSFLLKRSEDV